MASPAQAILEGSAVALRTVRQFLSKPSISYTPINADGTTGITQTVVMEVTSFEEIHQNQASKMLLVDINKGKGFLNDNIAPMPRVWQMSGYLFPKIPTITIVDQISLEIERQTLRDAANSRQLVQFKPVITSVLSQFSEQFASLMAQSVTGTIPVVITDLKFSIDATIQNKAPFSMTIQQIDTLSAALQAASNNVAEPIGLTNIAASPQNNNQGNTSYANYDSRTFLVGAQ